MCQVDDAAQAEDERQAQRQDDVIRPDQQAVQDLLEDDHRVESAGTVMSAPARSVLPGERTRHAASVQGFSCCAGWISSSDSPEPGTHSTTSEISHLSFIFAFALITTTYNSS